MEERLVMKMTVEQLVQRRDTIRDTIESIRQLERVLSANPKLHDEVFCQDKGKETSLISLGMFNGVVSLLDEYRSLLTEIMRKTEVQLCPNGEQEQITARRVQ